MKAPAVRAAALLALVAGALSMPLHACSEPTYVTVHLTTDVPCERLQGVTLTVGTLGALESKVATTRTAACQGGEIGTISVVPSAGDDEEFGVRVVMGIDRDVDSCVAPDYGDGCVVARRGLRFLPNEPLTLPIVLRQICSGIPCGPYDTCVRGVCVPATIDPRKCKGADGCGEDVLASGAGGGGDGGAGEAGAQDGGPPGEIDIYPVTALHPFCGNTTAIDLGAPWPMRGGCPTRANRTRFRGPTAQPRVVSTVNEGTAWFSLVVTDGDTGWGARDGDFASVFLATTDEPTSEVAGTDPGELGSCVLLPDGELCRGRSSVVDMDRQGNVRAVRNVSVPDAGSRVLLPPWTVGADRTAFVVLEGNDLIALEPNSNVRFQKRIDGVTIGPPALSQTGALLFVATENAVVAYDTTTGAERWKTPASTTGTVAVGPGGNVHTVVRVPEPDGGVGFALRTFNPAGGLFAADVKLEPTPPLSPNPSWGIATGRFGGESKQVALVVRDGRLDAIDVGGRQRLWSMPAPPEPQMLWSLNGVIYLAGVNTVTAISSEPNAVLWTQPGTWGAVHDLAIGEDGALYLASDKGLVRLPR